MPAVGAADWWPQPEPALHEVETITHRAPHAVEWHPADVVERDAALAHEIFHQSTDWVVGKCGDDGGVHPEASGEPARDVVFAAAFPYAELSRRGDALVARIESQHHFAERDEIRFATTFGRYFEG